MPFWRRRPLVEAAYADFAFECFAWYLRNTKTFWTRPLLRPTDQFFPQQGLQGHALAVATFDVLRKAAGLSRRNIRLEAQDPAPNARLGALVATGSGDLPAGTFQRTEGGALITYEPSLTRDPMLLVATLANQLAHYLMYGFRDRPPWVEEAYWHAREVGTVFIGGGLFLANARFEFSQHTSTFSIGWRWKTRGSLTEPQILYVLAVFCALREVPVTEVLPHLKSHMRGSYKRALREVAERGVQLDALRAIQPRSSTEPHATLPS